MRARDLGPGPHADVVKPFRGVFYGWWLVGAGAVMLSLMSLTIFHGLGTFLVALERQFGWSRTALSGAFVLARAEDAVIGPIEGFLIDRLGSRRMILIGYTIMGIGFVLFSRVESLWQFYLAFIVITLGAGLGGWLAMITVVNNWFARRRTFAIATAMSGVHVGGFLVPLLALGIESHGFRVTTLGVGLFLLATVLPLTKVIRNHPEDLGLLPDGDPPRGKATLVEEAGSTAEAEDEPDFTVRQALRTPVFWTLTVVHLGSSVSIITLALHLAPKLTDMGLSLSGAAIVVLTYTAVALPAQFVAGYLADRFNKAQVLFVFIMLQGVAVLVIAVAENLYMAYLFAVLYGIGFGGRVPLLTAIRGDYFGRKAFATIMGLSQFPKNIAMMGAPLFAGFMFDRTGSYFVPFTAFAVLNLLGGSLMVFVRKPKAAGPVQASGRKEVAPPV